MMRKRSLPKSLWVPVVLGAALLGGQAYGATPTSAVHVVKNPSQVGVGVYPRTAPTTVTVNLTAKEVFAELAPGKTFWFWTFAGADGQPTVPGPMIRAMEGDTIVINLTNDTLTAIEPHNIDLHAVMGPGGGAAVTNVLPGETATLRFKAMRAGAYVYHCAGEGMPWEHVSHGMYGMIVIEPPGGLAPGFKEFYVGQSEWYLTDTAIEIAQWLALGVPGVMSYDADAVKADIEHPDAFSFNGHTAALTSLSPAGPGLMTVNQNDKVRIFFVNGGPNKISSFHIIGQIFDKVYNGHPATPVRNEETVLVPPGSATVVEFQAMVPGQYLLVDHALFRVPKGAGGYLQVMQMSPTWPLNLYAPEAVGTGH